MALKVEEGLAVAFTSWHMICNFSLLMIDSLFY